MFLTAPASSVMEIGFFVGERCAVYQCLRFGFRCLPYFRPFHTPACPVQIKAGRVQVQPRPFDNCFLLVPALCVRYFRFCYLPFGVSGAERFR